jgi:8-oxo-dGTP diphosphatase
MKEYKTEDGGGNQPCAPQSRLLEVAAAVILAPDGRFLLAERPAGKPYAGYWEFPGGKIESGESAPQALVRELHEELGIDVEDLFPWITRVYAYPHVTVRLHFFRVARWRGEPHGKENQRLDWQSADGVTVAPLLPANGPVLRALSLPPIYAITNAGEIGTADFLRRLDAALDKGLRLIQVREKEMPGRARESFAAEVVRRAHKRGAKVLVNGDFALARRAGADGVHLPAAQLMGCEARPEVAWCGASCHSRQELEKAAQLGLDFAVLSPVRPTLSHPGASVLGWGGFAALIMGLPLPVYALGGMTPADLRTAWHHGAHGIAMQRGIW